MNPRALNDFIKRWTPHLILLAVVAISLFPIYLMVATSVKTQAELLRNVFAFSASPKWHNYWLVFVERGYYRSAINSTIFAGATTALTVVLSIAAAYGFTRFQFSGRRTILILILVAMMTSEVAILIPVYMMLKDLNLLNTYLGLIIPQVALGIPFGIFLLTTAFREIPVDLTDASRIDGCNDLQSLTHVVLPLGMPGIRALAVIEFLWAWNSFFFPLVIATRQDIMPMSVSIIDFMGRFTLNYELVATTCVMMFVPILILYLLTQSSFRRGITFGALK